MSVKRISIVSTSDSNHECEHSNHFLKWICVYGNIDDSTKLIEDVSMFRCETKYTVGMSGHGHT